MSNIRMKVTLGSMMLVAVLLALSVDYHGGIVPEVRADEQNAPPCSLHTLRGSYGQSFQFLNTFPSNAGQPIVSGTHTPGAGLGLVTFDGEGGYITQLTISSSGHITRSSRTGTYTVNANCTGSIAFPAVQIEFVIVDKGKEILGLVVDVGDVAVSNWKKQF